MKRYTFLLLAFFLSFSLHAVGLGTSSSISVSCKTYEGKIYDKGEAGYNDCIRTIKTDRQSEKQVP